MAKKEIRTLPKLTHLLRAALLGLLLTLTPMWSAMAADLPLAAGSPIAGITFDDRPLLLPVQRNFQMAMLTASSELGRSCGRMESYGWRMGATEQQRVNTIFTSTVDRLRALGYGVEARALNSISSDITLFTADRADRHFLFMWSAGEIGLVMVLCESSPPLNKSALASPLPTTYPQDVMKSKLDTPAQTKDEAAAIANFTPVGSWTGGYTCTQGYTGAALDITQLHGENFQGVFRFYPTPKNPYVPKGSYSVSGQYDSESQRILINPGKWIVHPKGYYNTVMVGGFDPSTRSFSSYFQGISGCTSFEAKRADSSVVLSKKKAKAKAKKKAVTHKAAAKVEAPVVVEPALQADVPVATKPDISLSATPAAPVPAPVVAPAATTAAPVPAAPAVASPVIPAPAAATEAPLPVSKEVPVKAAAPDISNVPMQQEVVIPGKLMQDSAKPVFTPAARVPDAAAAVSVAPATAPVEVPASSIMLSRPSTDAEKH